MTITYRAALHVQGCLTLRDESGAPSAAKAAPASLSVKGSIVSVMPQSGYSVAPSSGTGSLCDVLELILDRGLVIDAFTRAQPNTRKDGESNDSERDNAGAEAGAAGIRPRRHRARSASGTVSPEEDRADRAATVYAYALTLRDHPLRLDGLNGVGAPPTPLRTVPAGPLCAVVSDVSEEPHPTERDIGAHHDVQQRLMESGVVLPLRFGATAPDDDAVRSAVEEHADDYAERLRQLDGCVEYSLKAAQEARQPNDHLRDAEADSEAGSRQGELDVQNARPRLEALASGVTEAFRPFTREVKPGAPSGEDFLSVSFLVSSDQDELFTASEMSLAHQMGEDFDFRLHGPLPPYSFV